MFFLLLAFSTLEVCFQLKNCFLPNAFKMTQNVNIWEACLLGVFVFFFFSIRVF